MPGKGNDRVDLDQLQGKVGSKCMFHGMAKFPQNTLILHLLGTFLSGF